MSIPDLDPAPHIPFPPAEEISDSEFPVHPDVLDWEAENIPEPPPEE